MEIRVLKIARSEPEELEIRCHEVTEEVKEIITFVKSRQGQLTGVKRQIFGCFAKWGGNNYFQKVCAGFEKSIERRIVRMRVLDMKHS